MRAVGDEDRTDRLARVLAFDSHADVGPHAVERRDETDPVPVEANTVEPQRRTGQRRRRCRLIMADEGSPGTTSAAWGAVACCPPSTRHVRPSVRLVRPNVGKARSVWSRVASGSRTLVVPAARRPASMRALLTWALGTGDVQSIAESDAP